MKRRILSLLLVLTLLLALPVAAAAEESGTANQKNVSITVSPEPDSTTDVIDVKVRDTLTFQLKDAGGNDVNSGILQVPYGNGTKDMPVTNGVVTLPAAYLIMSNNDRLDQGAYEYCFKYMESSDGKPIAEITLNISVHRISVPSIAMTSNYALGNQIDGFRASFAPISCVDITGGTGRIYNEKGDLVNTGIFDDQTYTALFYVSFAGDYKPADDFTLTLDGKTGTSKETGDGKYEYVFELYPTYTVTYDSDGGTLSSAPTQYDKNSGEITIPRPTKDGFRFTGWTGTDLTDKTLDVVIPTGAKGNREYTAHWEEIVYRNVYFVSRYGTAPQAQQVESGTKATKPADPTEDGWRFQGWHRNNDYMDDPFDFDTPITENTTLYAKWAKTWTVTFDANGHGTAPAAQTVEEGENAVKPADLTAEGYSFQGWYTDTRYTMEYDFSKEVTEDITVYAKWVKKPIVSFNTNGHGTAPASQTVELNGKAAKPADPTAEGYVFRGWYTTAACTTEFDFNTPIAADTTLYAKWDEIYTVTFNVGGHGTAPAAQKVENGGKATKPENPTAKGWRFDGWYTDEKCTARYDFDKAVTANTTLYAKWTQLFTLTFDTNGGTKIDSVEAPDGSLVYLGSYKPTKSGYYFVGWYTDKNLTQASRVSYVRMDGNKTVYAKFAVADKTNPKTADPALPGLALAVLSFSTVGLAAMGLKKRK